MGAVAGERAGRRMPRLVALAHPFPSTLDAMAAASLGWLAGAAPIRAGVIGAAMLLLQVAIGATNDLADVDHDRIAKPGKPIPAGTVPVRAAASMALFAGGAGLALAFALGIAPGLIAVAGLSTGLLYDLALKRTMLSWLPYALGLPLLPAYAWVAARGVLPGSFPLLVGLAMLAGTALSFANGLADRPDDVSSGSSGLVVRLGARTTWRLLAVLEACLIAGGGYGIVAAAPGPGPIVLLAAGALAVIAGTLAAGAPRAMLRRHGWEVQAVGIALLAVALLAATNRSSR